MGYGSGMGWGWIFWLLMLIGIVLVIVVVVRLLGGGVRREDDSTRADARPSGRSRAREVLDERYARGELTTEEYRERFTALGENE
ncbi:SHOCT domain-containing protein [Blastococcus sp. CT_GayMR16]|uniref:SHOCT domain-containing protein n=1 Tax=Blastococcus sp. CT_GayMR16 TaxID=2559607 RepID=UPI001073EF50|nr:SHOCT domain-containing protein [Blastococcus sp. CT_GayMR16]TFV91103.1 SHOCT domain-containing protein [Blastococcus sp. CT_GayMR16]